MKFVTWNVNGLRACMNKGFMDYFQEMDADMFGIQETKMQEDQKSFDFEGYFEYWNNAIKKGYSGTLVYTKHKPLSVRNGLEDGKYNDEGRIITVEYESFYFVTVYVPNSKEGLARIDYRIQFEADFLAYLKRLDQHKPVILCGDLNVAHKEIDLKNPKANEQNAGYSVQERTCFQELLDGGFVDTFRLLYPMKVQYTWWSYMFNARANNAGWRIDYFVLSARLIDKVKSIEIHDHVHGSDHCPVVLEMDL
ncbi:MAG: exodeoxyribonuclease III [Candidatus Izemoplasmatales bacterium]|nr:exodeoxyribonuclease III [bacterium]MDZ4196464.1 exodeoxyribonuclease III [Candidatus Izemoplasmatales bacterium]